MNEFLTIKLDLIWLFSEKKAYVDGSSQHGLIPAPYKCGGEIINVT